MQFGTSQYGSNVYGGKIGGGAGFNVATANTETVTFYQNTRGFADLTLNVEL